MNSTQDSSADLPATEAETIVETTAPSEHQTTMPDDRSKLYARLMLTGIIVVAFLGLLSYASHLDSLPVPYPEVEHREVSFNQATNPTLFRQVQANKKHTSYVTDVEFAAMAGWVVAPLLIIACWSMKFPELE